MDAETRAFRCAAAQPPVSFRAVARPRGRRSLSGELRRSLAAVFLIAFAGSNPAGASGYLDVFISSRTFQTPLFRGSSLTVFRLFAAEKHGGQEFSLLLSDGFPALDETITASLRKERVFGGELAAQFGHVVLIDGGLRGGGSGLPLEGISAAWGTEGLRASLSLGRARYPVRRMAQEPASPALFAASIERGSETSFASLGIFASGEPLSATGGDGGELILTPGINRQLSLSTELFAETPIRPAGGAGYRLGARWNRLAHGVEAALFDHPDEFPLLLPLYRPGESGIEITGRVAPTPGTLVRATTTFLTKDLADSTEDFRGRIMVTRALGGPGRLMMLYDHNQYQHRGLDERDSGGVRNRLLLSLASYRSGDHSELRVLHDFESGSSPAQSEASFRWIRSGDRINWNGEATVQREGGEAHGAVAEAAMFLPWRMRYQWVVGAAATWASRGGEPSGQGALRFGVVRQNAIVAGWNGGVEVRIPVSIGLTDVDARDVRFAASVGNRFSWEAARDILPAFALFDAIGGRGTIEGVVRADAPLSGIPVLVEGRPAALTDEQGRFRITRVKEGAVAVSIDLSRADPSISGESAQVVTVAAGETARISFALERGFFVQGALLCSGPAPGLPVGNASIALVGDEIAYRGQTSAVGGFQFANVRRGSYQLLIDPETGTPRVDAPAFERIEIDVTADRMGQILRVACLPRE